MLVPLIKARVGHSQLPQDEGQEHVRARVPDRSL